MRLGWLVFLGLVACQEPVQQSPQQTIAPPEVPIKNAPPPTFANVVERVRPAVVNIYTRKALPAERVIAGQPTLVPKERLAQSLGSGFIIDETGHVITNFHVIEGATQIEVRLFDERWFKADVVGDDARTDIALLKLREAESLPTVALGDSDALRVGDWVLAIGNPLGLTSTVTVGIASATGRKHIPMGGDLGFQDFIQTDASINPGNSGGPLVDLEGTVVGVNTAVASGQGIGFAVPVNMVNEILDRLKEGGHLQRSWLGLYVDDVPKALRAEIGLPAQGGALVTGVVKGGPGELATLRPGDVILKFDGQVVADASRLAWIAGNVGVGKKAIIAAQRGNQALTLEITMGAPPKAE